MPRLAICLVVGCTHTPTAAEDTTGTSGTTTGTDAPTSSGARRRPLTSPRLHHAELAAGGLLRFDMTATPGSWGQAP